MSNLKISQVEIVALSQASHISADIADGISRLLPQLSSNAVSVDAQFLETILKSGNTTIFIASHQGDVLGSLTLVFYTTPRSKRARIEDVVVDTDHRGIGIGKNLTVAALELAKKLGAKNVDLTTRPDRDAANQLYQKLGFERRDTGVYRKCL